MNLIVDIGNSFAKTAVFQNSELVDQWKVEVDRLQKHLQEIFLSVPHIKKGIISNVSGKPVHLSKEVKSQWEIIELDYKTPLLFKNCYKTPETLGRDRIALVAAAAQRFPDSNVLVIDAGTCLTFDFKNSKNEYLGGAISPGLQMRFKALHTFTGRLPLVQLSEEISLTGRDTVSSISSGVIFGISKEIDGIIDEYKARYKDLTIIFTGGDAEVLSIKLKNSIFANSNFLLEGLNFILEFNNTQ